MTNQVITTSSKTASMTPPTPTTSQTIPTANMRLLSPTPANSSTQENHWTESSNKPTKLKPNKIPPLQATIIIVSTWIIFPLSSTRSHFSSSNHLQLPQTTSSQTAPATLLSKNLPTRPQNQTNCHSLISNIRISSRMSTRTFTRIPGRIRVKIPNNLIPAPITSQISSSIRARTSPRYSITIIRSNKIFSNKIRTHFTKNSFRSPNFLN